MVNSAPAPDVVFSRVSKLFHGLALIPPIERTFALIKPDAVHSADAIIEAAKKNGFVVIEKKYVNVTNEQADTFFAELKGICVFSSHICIYIDDEWSNIVLL